MSFKDNLKSFAGNLPTQIGNGIIGGAFNLAASAFNARLAEKAAQNEYNRQLDFWQKQNEYNTPLNQRKRLEQAGFNPAVAINGVAGNNTAGQLSSVPSNEVDKRGRLDLNSLNNSIALLGQMESVGANTNLLKRQVELAAMQEIIMNHHAYGIDIDNKTKLEYLKRIGQKEDLTLEMMLAEIENIKSSTANTNKDTEKKEAEIGQITIQTAVGESTIVLNNAQKQYTEALTNTVNATRQYDIELKQASAEQLRSSASLAREQCNKTREEAHALKDDDRIRTWNITIGEFYHMGDISVLPSELQTKAAEYYWDFQTGEKTLESTIDAFYKQVNRYIEKNGHIVTSISEGRSANASVGGSKKGISANAGVSKNFSYSY